MTYSPCNIPRPEEELKCCCTPDSPNREVSMTENLKTTSDNLVAINSMLEKLNHYIFAVDEKENLDLPSPCCMRDAIYANEFLADMACEKLKRLVDRICV